MSTNNGKPARTLDPEAERTAAHVRAHREDIAGDIIPAYLRLALPLRGINRSYGDAIAGDLLAHILGQYRWLDGSRPWWSGPLYQVNRKDLAHRLATTPDEISAALMWLYRQNLLGRMECTVPNEVTGKPVGKNVYYWPNVPAIVELLKKAKASTNPYKSTRTAKLGGLEVASSDKAKLPVLTRQVASSDKAKLPASFLTSSKPQQNNNTTADLCGVVQPSAVAPPALRSAARSSEDAEAEPIWETFPDSLEGIDLENEELTPEQKAGLVRCYIGTYHRKVFGSVPELSADKFEEGVAKVDPTLDWEAADYILITVAGWFWARDGITEDNGHVQNFWSCLCSPEGKNGLAGLFKTYKDDLLGLEYVREELNKESGYRLKFGERTLEQVETWIGTQLEKRGIVKNPDKYYADDDTELCDVNDTWAVVYLVFTDWIRWDKYKPDDAWLDAITERFQAEGPPKDGFYLTEYRKIGQALINKKLLPGENVYIDW